MRKNEITAKKYELEISDNIYYYWDLGVLIMQGNKDNPTRKIDNMDFFQSIVNGIDAESLSEKAESVTKEKIELYVGDYCTYIPAEHGEFIISSDNTLYEIMEEYDGGYILMKKNIHTNQKIHIKKEDISKEWVRCMQI